MIINKKKTKVNFPGDEPLEVIHEIKLLGVMITSDLTWNSHVQYITKNASKKLWHLIRFKNMGGTVKQLLRIFELKVRTLLEFSAPVFHFSLTKEQSQKIELVQKKALAIILGNRYHSYKVALQQTKLERLDLRREKLCYKFALKCTKNPRHSEMFPLNPHIRKNMRKPKLYKEFNCKTIRFYKSAVPYMTWLLNKNN